jgi:hypothetical protein
MNFRAFESLVAVLLTAAVAASVLASQTSRAARLRECAPPIFDGLVEDGRALSGLFMDWRIFLRIVWPWLLGSAVCLGTAMALSSSPERGSPWLPALQLATVGVVVIGVPTSIVAWHRWTIERREPGWIVLPDSRAFSYGWRLWLFTILANRAAGLIGYAFVNATRQADPTGTRMTGAVLEDLIFAAACIAISRVALVLPAVALGDKAFVQDVALVQARRLGLGLPVGLCLAIAPFVLIEIALDIWTHLSPRSGFDHATLPQAVQAGVGLTMFFVAYGAAASLLSRAYVVAKNRAPVSA